MAYGITGQERFDSGAWIKNQNSTVWADIKNDVDAIDWNTASQNGLISFSGGLGYSIGQDNNLGQAIVDAIGTAIMAIAGSASYDMMNNDASANNAIAHGINSGQYDAPSYELGGGADEYGDLDDSTVDSYDDSGYSYNRYAFDSDGGAATISSGNSFFNGGSSDYTNPSHQYSII